jgi:hypothetical protein
MWSFNSSPPSKPKKKKKNEEKQPAKKLSSCEYLAACSVLVSISLKPKNMITSSSTKETCYEILTGEQLFFQ